MIILAPGGSQEVVDCLLLMMISICVRDITQHSVITKIISGLPDKMSGRPSVLCRTFSTDWQISVVILVSLVTHFMSTQHCWTKCPARSELSAGLQQKSAGHVRHVRHISRSLNIHQQSDLYIKAFAFFWGSTSLYSKVAPVPIRFCLYPPLIF